MVAVDPVEHVSDARSSPRCSLIIHGVVGEPYSSRQPTIGVGRGALGESGGRYRVNQGLDYQPRIRSTKYTTSVGTEKGRVVSAHCCINCRECAGAATSLPMALKCRRTPWRTGSRAWKQLAL